jgi:hypothetical protein
LIRGRKLETVAATDGLVAWVDVLQSELDEGPCQDSSRQRQTLLDGDLAADRRRPRWAAKVTALGIASVLAAELTGNRACRIGSIAVYWTQPRTFTAQRHRLREHRRPPRRPRRVAGPGQSLKFM